MCTDVDISTFLCYNIEVCVKMYHAISTPLHRIILRLTGRGFMKIKIIEKPYSEVIAEYKAKKEKHKKPKRPNIFFRTLMKLVALPDLLSTHFKCERVGVERLGKREPAFILMNHSSFIDLEIVAEVLYPRPFNIVATTDGFIGKDWLMREIGCIPTKKFVTDTTLVRDMLYTARNLRDSIVMYPEVGYSHDGTATTLPDSIGKCVKLLGLPLCMITTYGAFARDPLYNNLHKRKVDVSARFEYLLSPDEIKEKSAEEINEIVREKFSFDNFSWQENNHVKIDDSTRAEGLNRVLYKCPECKCEGKMLGEGIYLECTECGAKYRLDEYGALTGENVDCKMPHIPDWYAWQREEVKAELERGEYEIDAAVDIMVSVDTKRLFHVGGGRLIHTSDGFRLISDDGELEYVQTPLASYSVNADFNWYELGDIIGIGNSECLYYCFPKEKGDIVSKIRFAAEELYKIKIKEKEDGENASATV